MADPVLPRKKVRKGEELFREGDPGTEAYLIHEGYVSIWREEGGQRVNLARRAAGEVVGEMALIDDMPRSASVTAEADLELEVITREQLHAMLDRAPESMAVILHQLLEALRSANDLIAMYASRLAVMAQERKG